MSGPIATVVYAAADFCSDLEQGAELGIPLCCRLRFALETALTPHHDSALHRGIRFNHDGIEYVPCGWLHQPTISHADYERQLQEQ
jgi:hypothetical protein